MKILLLHILRRIITFIGVVLLLWILVPAIIISSFHIGTYTGIIISLILIMYGVFGGFFHMGIKYLWQSVPGKILLGFMAAICGTILALAIASIISIESADAADDRKSGTVLVLGCLTRSNGPSQSLQLRLDTALEYLEENPEAICIVSGGQGVTEPVSEAESMKDYLVEQGISPSRIYMEDQSTDTDENLEFSKKIIDEEGLDNTVMLVTSDYHIYRTLKRAEIYGIDGIGLGAPTPLWLWPAAYIREMYGIMELWFIG